MAYRDLYLFQILFCLVIAVCMWFFLKRVFASKHKRKKGKSGGDDTGFYDSSDSSSGDSDWGDDGGGFDGGDGDSGGGGDGD